MTHEAATTVKELPEALPANEHILWQCAPNWRSVFRRAMHGRTLAIYFAVLLVLRAANVLWDGGSVTDAVVAVLWLAPIALFALGVVALVAWLTARSTWYTLTDRRVIMRIGIVLEITFNFPYKVIDDVGLRLYPNGTGDIPFRFMEGEQIAYVHLWPHARPWRVRRTEPMLRCVPDAARVAELLARAIASQSGGSALPVRVTEAAGDSTIGHNPQHATANAA